MVNLIWAFMFIFGIVFAAINGTMDEVNKVLFTSAQEAVTICLGLISILVFWLGLMNVAKKAGLLDKLTGLFRPAVSRLFPEIPKNDPAMGYILSNMVANLFGLGNAATPMGIKAMEEMKRLNGGKSEASRSMITFLAINTSSLTLIPTTVIAIRMNYGSASPTEIVSTTIIATTCSTLSAILIDRFFHSRTLKKRRI
ncbi:nucleoside recognition domain-containing protein [Alkalihalobacillus sp. AL-G]|uniref:nucleoside recognition domain-containing protein n=1 Tax=Alkalihalobacillus sp. AL-G TaxID=2926399 RepID=UPI00272DB325|nr:nucleoside recognition domain-containing protein [Alkalihalobacillus sp. AL-G]WLD91874.1 spore maturation protein [Alkalihalobacillus sp. AL-G]